MKKILFALCLVVVFLMQSCVATIRPMGDEGEHHEHHDNGHHDHDERH